MPMRSFRADQADIDRWEAVCAERGLKFSPFVREAIETFIARPQRPGQRSELVTQGACLNRVPRGAFCHICSSVHA